MSKIKNGSRSGVIKREQAIIKDLIQKEIYLQIKREYFGVDKLYNDL